MAMDFPVTDLMDERACYDQLMSVLHPHGLACPGCGAREGLGVHRRRRREPVLDYQCSSCGRVFNAFTGTPLAGTPRRPSQVVLVLRGVAKGEGTAGMSRELACSRCHLLELRHRLQADAAAAAPERFDRQPPPDAVTESDEMYQNAGGKKASRTATRPTRPGGGPTSGAATAAGTTAARRSSGSSGVRAGGCGWRWCAAAPASSWSRGWRPAPPPGRR